MAHNGGKVQVNLGNAAFWHHGFMFLNYVKGMSVWTPVGGSTTALDPSKHDDDGWLHTLYADGSGVGGLLLLPKASQRPGNRFVIKWKRTATVTITGGWAYTLISGSLSGSNGRAVVERTDPEANVPQFNITSVGAGADYGYDFVFCHEDDEALIDAGQIFNPTFLSKLPNIGVARCMDLLNTNTTNHFHWEDRTPLSHWSYGAPRMVPSIYAGTTGGTSEAYTASLSGFVLEHGARAQLVFHTNATINNPTLNIEGTGAIELSASTGAANTFSGQRPTAGTLAHVIYNADVNRFIQQGGMSGVNQFNYGLTPTLPHELIIQLCLEYGMHPWINIPHYSCDDPNINDAGSYVKSVATMYRDELAGSGLVPRYECSNEVWNGLFLSTQYATAVQTGRGYGVSFPYQNWHGWANSRVGQAISAVYSDDRTKYQIIVGVQMYGAPSNSAARLESTDYVTETGVSANAAKNWVTHIAPADYVGAPTPPSAGDVSEWADVGTSEARKAEIIRNYVANNGSWNTEKTNITGWLDWLETNYPGLKMTYYEGGFNVDFTTGTTDEKAFKRAAYFADNLETLTRDLWAFERRLGTEFPSLFALEGNSIWGIHYPSPYEDPDERWTAFQNDNAGKRFFKVTCV